MQNLTSNHGSPFLQSSPDALRSYTTVFLDYPGFNGLKLVAKIFQLRARAMARPLRLVLHRIVIATFLQAMDISSCTIFDSVVMYRCVYNKDHLRMLFLCCGNALTWTFPSRPRSSYTRHCGCPLPPLSNLLKFPALKSLTLCPEYGNEVSYQSNSWLQDLARASMKLEELNVAFTMANIAVVIKLLEAAHRTLQSLSLKVIQGAALCSLLNCSH